jgi:DNA-binding CsgD family transcriptional regulator
MSKHDYLIAKKQKLLTAIIIFLLLSAIGFHFDLTGSRWFWNDYPVIPVLLILVVFLMAALWIKGDRYNLKKLYEAHSSEDELSGSFQDKIRELSLRQQEVFDLIVQGKSNKEIMDQLNIELSTLKTHINQIYKILKITNRKKARSIGHILKSPNPDR